MRSAGPPGFSARTMAALVAVGLVSFSALAVLSVYAPDFRGGLDPRPHALSGSAVGLKGAVVMMKAEGAPVVVLRTQSKAGRNGLMVLTPEVTTSRKDLDAFGRQAPLLIVLPKWTVTPQPLHIGYVDKVGAVGNTDDATSLLKAYAKATEISHRTGISRPVLRGGGSVFATGTYLPLGEVDALQTVGGEDWVPALVDESGRMVVAQSRSHTGVFVLADPDLLNNQGLAKLDNARAGMAILNVLRGEEGVLFDVTLNGFKRGRGIGRLLLEPPWLSATLCAVAAGLLLGLHGLARFGAARTRGRAIAFGKAALVESSAGLVRMARREAELAPAYAALTKSLVGRVAGGGDRAVVGADNERWLADLARLRGASPPDELTGEAERARTSDDLLRVARKLYFWRREMTREGR